MEMPRPNEAHDRLHAFRGAWSGVETMPPSQWAPKELIATARVVNRVAVGGFILTQDYEQCSDGKVTFSGHGVLWLDHETGAVVLHFWDAMGMGPDEFRGGWEGDALVLSTHNVMGHWRGRWTPGADRYTHTMESSKDGESWSLMMSGVYTREG